MDQISLDAATQLELGALYVNSTPGVFTVITDFDGEVQFRASNIVDAKAMVKAKFGVQFESIGGVSEFGLRQTYYSDCPSVR
jgi:hypothetical protein